MKTLIAIASFTAVCFAADDSARRLESVAWDPVKHQLQWVVSKGEVKEGEYKAATKQQYNIDVDSATMSFSDETRRFSKDEAVSVRRLLDLLARYAAESTVWWEEGQGEPVTKGLRVSLPQRREIAAAAPPGGFDGLPAGALMRALAAPFRAQDQSRGYAGTPQR